LKKFVCAIKEFPVLQKSASFSPKDVLIWREECSATLRRRRSNHSRQQARAHHRFPTANLKPVNRVIPKYGVYATATLIKDVWRRSITNVGVRPTFDGDREPSIETYVFNFDGDLYGDVLRVRFLHRIRDERKFSGIDELKTQIEKDSNHAREYFKRVGVQNSLDIV
jgi:FAD synthase